MLWSRLARRRRRRCCRGRAVAVTVAVHDTIANAWRRQHKTKPQRNAKTARKAYFPPLSVRARAPHAQTKASNRRLLSARACCTRAYVCVCTYKYVCVCVCARTDHAVPFKRSDGEGRARGIGGIWNDDQRAKRAPSRVRVCVCVCVCVRVCACGRWPSDRFGINARAL